MPFKSKLQMKAAFATGGFGGAIDPKEWAKKTKGKKLPMKTGGPEKAERTEAHKRRARAVGKMSY